MSEQGEPSSVRSSRTRRKTSKAVDYAADPFSDEDLMEEDEKEIVTNRRSRSPIPESISSARRARKPRKSDARRVSDTYDQMDEYGYSDLTKTEPVFTEKGYDPNELPIRERFLFAPEYEADGTPKIDCIVGRRIREAKRQIGHDLSDEDEAAEDEETETVARTRKAKVAAEKLATAIDSGQAEYEYLIKYKGVSYLHLEWKLGTELESMNKSAKTIYRRFLKKLEAGTEEGLEDPTFDPSFIDPQRIVDEQEQEIEVDMTDKEIIQWEKEEKQRRLESGEESDDEEEEDRKPRRVTPEEKVTVKKEEPAPNKNSDPAGFKLYQIRKIVMKEPYYPVIVGSDNPYRDGYVTHAPKKPRPSYLLFQHSNRMDFQARYPNANVAEIMTMLGDAWKNMPDEDQAPYIQLAAEEAQEYDRQKALCDKGQKPTDVWQPMRRCLMVLERLAQDSYADIFLEPVDTETFPDYLDIIDNPMDIGTVRDKLVYNKYPYQAPEMFARDMRKIWNNCKIYNQHGSAIWHVADYMSKQFERLYQAWVTNFKDKHLRWVEPKARPWETSCRACDGVCKVADEEMIVCDHCDAMFGMKCLKPPIKKLPRGIWRCPDCRKQKNKTRMLSAVAEQAARKRAELGDIPKKRMKQKKYLVKWVGLGYEHCSWETSKDINDDALIAEYRKLNHMVPDEPLLSYQEVQQTLNSTKHEFGADIELGQLYALTRAFEFAKFGKDIPQNVMLDCGPECKGSTLLSDNIDSKLESNPLRSQENSDNYKAEVAKVLSELEFYISKPGQNNSIISHTSELPKLLTAEYDAIVPITSKGLMMNVGEMNGSVSFLGYRQFPDGTPGPAEQKGLIKSIGDKIIAVNGQSTSNMIFKEVIELLREAGKYSFCHMRFLRGRYSAVNTDWTSCGHSGSFMIQTLADHFRIERRNVLSLRTSNMLDGNEVVEDDNESIVEEESDDGSSSSGSESDDEFEEDSGDEEVVKRAGNGSESQVSKGMESIPSDAEVIKPASNDESKESLREKISSVEYSESGDDEIMLLSQRETTRSLALRLLDIDIGYSSDECGEEDSAYFIDGVDKSFRRVNECVSKVIEKNAAPAPKKGGKELMKKEKKVNFREFIDTDTELPIEFYKNKGELPAKRNEFMNLGQRSKLCASVFLTSEEPRLEEFFSYGKEPEMESKEKEIGEHKDNEANKDEQLPMKIKSSTKIEQVDTTTSSVIHVWPSAKSAALTLQLQLPELQSMLDGEYNENLGDDVGGFHWRYADEDAIITAGITGAAGSSQKSKQAYLEFKDKLYDPNKPHIYKNENALRDYQVDGVNWLASCWYKRHNAILADEMGLGKTVQIVTYLEHIYRVEKIKRPFLVVVPLSTVEHWRREFTSWTDMVCCIYHDRQRIWRDVSREYEWYYKDRPHTPEYLKFDVLVTTYDTLIADIDIVGGIPFRVAVVDEAHRLRNVKGKLLECMKLISQQGTLKYGFQSRILMTGTPLQNNTQELWTLLNYIEPFQFPSLDEFQLNFGDMKNQAQVLNLQRKISPFMLRRVKEDVAKDIPSKEETLIDVELTSIQKQYYRAIFEHNHTFLSMGVGRAGAPKLMNIQMELRKCCNHPFLLEGVEQREMSQYRTELIESNHKHFNKLSEHEKHQILNEHGFVMSSGKMVLLDKLLPKLRSEGHKVLIFSQMVRMLDLISDFLDFRGFRHERLDGRVRGNERQKSIDRFNTEKDSFVFLLSTRAGGVGINLTAADTCIIFDSDWNPQNDVQAQARCHRIGQTRDVRIYRLITSRTFEQEMFDRASRKLGLEQAVLGTFDKDDDDGKPTHKEMERLLKRGAYALMEDDDDNIGREFCEDDIENILAKRTRTRVVEGTKTASWLNKQGFTKTKFTGESAAGTSSVAVDDPLFWQKIMPDFVTPQIMLTKLNEIDDRFTKECDVIDEDKDIDELKSTSENNSDEEKPVTSMRGRKGRGRKRKQAPAAAAEKVQLPEPILNQVTKFIADLTSMMDDIFSKAEDENLPSSDKEACQKLLLKLSVKNKIFNSEQRELATSLLARLEGDRRRRCRTEDTSSSYRYGHTLNEDTPGTKVIPEQLLILSKHKKRVRRQRDKKNTEEAKTVKDKNSQVGDDGYLHHSDSDMEGEWSDVNIIDEEDPYTKKKGISAEEAKKRFLSGKTWANDKNPLEAAARPWPALPRHKVYQILESLLDEVIANDEENGGIFSEPVSKEEFPEYFDVIKEPMDYGTMKEKLQKGEYKTARSMQKDFVLVMTNCSTFNSPDSDIVKEAQQQALSMPKLLREAAFKHQTFLSEDGSVLDVIDENDQLDKNLDLSKKRSSIGDNERRLRCGKCAGCRQKDCGECSACKDKKKFGGSGLLRQVCSKRSCLNLKTPEEKYGKKRKQKALEQAIKNGDPLEDLETLIEETKPRKRGPKPKKDTQSKKRKRKDMSEDDNSESSIEPQERKVRDDDEDRDNDNGDTLAGADEDSDPEEMPMDDKMCSPSFDVEYLRKERKEAFDGSFESARKFYTARGPWILPKYINSSKWVDVAKMTLSKVAKEDKYDLFAEAVTEEQAPGYSKIIKNPMDFSRMRSKLEGGDYSDIGISGIFNDFLLVMDNCALYNGSDDEITEEAARVMSLLPAMFASSCAAV